MDTDVDPFPCADTAGPVTLRTQLERQLAAAQRITHIGSWEWALATGRVRWSDELYRIYGLEPQSIEVTFDGFLAMVHPADRERVRAAVGRALESGGRFVHRERIVRADGSVRHLDSVGEAVVAPSGEVLGLIGTCRDVTEERRRDEAIELYANIVENVQIALSVWRLPEVEADSGLILAAFNPALERATGVALEGALGAPLERVLSGLSKTEVPETLLRVARDGRTREVPSFRLAMPEHGYRTFAAKAFPLPGRAVGLALEDVTAQSRMRQLQNAEQSVLEMVAAGASLERVLTALVLAVERHSPPTIASILLLDAERACVRHGAAPHLPESYVCGIDGEPIGPDAGSCGTAAYLGRPVFVTDIATDPLWRSYRDLALSHGLRACWSTPILSSEGRVLGTFALYYREPRRPSTEELELIARVTHVAGIAIQRRQLDDQLRALTAHAEAVREDERSSMAREIHDQLGQALTALKMDVAWLGRRGIVAEGDTVTEERLASMSSMIDSIIDQVRRISSELRPGVLDDLGLAAAIEWQALQFARRFDIPCELDSNVQDERFARDVSTALFRILQEALTNVARHARASHVEISLMRAGSLLTLCVRDDGIGISEDALALPSSLGLLGMRERARRVGGSAVLSGEPGAGTRLTVQVPLGGGGET